MKPFYMSRTFWVQVFALVAIAVPASSSFIQQNLGEAGIMWAVINMALRVISKDRISIT